MKSFVFPLLVALVGSGLLIAQRYEAEIRNYLGLPEIAEEAPAEIEGKEKSKRVNDSNARRPTGSDAPMPNAGDLAKAAILQIVTLRYPDYPEVSFEESVPDLTSLTLDAYPDRVTVTKPLNLKLTSDGTVAGASFIKAGGSLRPLKLSDDSQLTLASLAHKKLTTSVPVSDTNFETAVRDQFAQAAKEANERLQAMRDADASYFRENSRVLENLNRDDSLWGDPTDADLPSVQAALEQKLNRSGFKAKTLFNMNRQSIEVDGEKVNCKAILVLLEGKDRGFGPYRWRSIAYLRGKEVIKWQDFPDDAVQAARISEQR